MAFGEGAALAFECQLCTIKHSGESTQPDGLDSVAPFDCKPDRTEMLPPPP